MSIKTFTKKQIVVILLSLVVVLPTGRYIYWHTGGSDVVQGESERTCMETLDNRYSSYEIVDVSHKQVYISHSSESYAFDRDSGTHSSGTPVIYTVVVKNAKKR